MASLTGFVDFNSVHMHVCTYVHVCADVCVSWDFLSLGSHLLQVNMFFKCFHFQSFPGFSFLLWSHGCAVLIPPHLNRKPMIFFLQPIFFKSIWSPSPAFSGIFSSPLKVATSPVFASLTVFTLLWILPFVAVSLSSRFAVSKLLRLSRVVIATLEPTWFPVGSYLGQGVQFRCPRGSLSWCPSLQTCYLCRLAHQITVPRDSVSLVSRTSLLLHESSSQR